MIATYNSEPAGLRRVTDSIARQSMPARQVEVLFIDDGSTDGTLARLHRHSRLRPNVAVHAIPNSGWASRPRNIGIGLARGEYLLFMDHDDELYPRALENAYEYGRRHDADLINAKEVRTGGWSWGWDSFARDVPCAAPEDVQMLIPMTPHKLYRREFLLREGIVFPEGVRPLWEDIYFNTAALAHGAKVAVFTQTPFYHWVKTAGNTSSTFGRHPEEFWSKVAGLFTMFEKELAGLPSRQPLIEHTARSRVLRIVGPEQLKRSPGWVDIMYRHSKKIVAEHLPPERDSAFRSVDRCRLELLRLGDLQLQRKLAEFDRDVTAIATIDTVGWEGPELVLTVETALVGSSGVPVRLRRDGARWVRELPPELMAVLSPAAVDVTNDLEQASFAISVKGRASRSTWAIPGESRVVCTDDGTGCGVVTARATVRFDPATFARAHDLDDPVWDFAARLAVMGYGAHRGLRGGRTAIALLPEGPAITYVNKSALFSLDVAGNVCSVTGSAPPRVSDVHIRTAARRSNGLTVSVTIVLSEVQSFGAARTAGTMLIGSTRKVPATLTDRAGTTVLEFSANLPTGEFVLRTKFLGRVGTTGLRLCVGETAHVEAITQQ